MTDLTEFLLARIDEDSRLARFATEGESGRWHTSVEETGDGENAYWAVADDDHMNESYFADLQSPGASRAEHIARWDPVRVLLECDAKRRVVEGIRDATNPGRTPAYIGPVMTSDHVLWFIALPYAAHPDFDPEWRP